jgi:hypothetical protein
MMDHPEGKSHDLVATPSMSRNLNQPRQFRLLRNHQLSLLLPKLRTQALSPLLPLL